MDEARINFRKERLQALTDQQIAGMYYQFERWRYKTPEQIIMFADIKTEISRRERASPFQQK
jgi:acyl dehydratase